MMAGVTNKDRRELSKLDLFNFDTPENKGSRYILTSPRSLKACSRLQIKPVELLPKTLSEFSASVPSLPESGDALLSVYQEWERERRSKLQAARREREKFVAEMEGRGLNQRVGTQSSNVEIVTITADTKQDPSAKDDLKEKDHRILEALAIRYESEEQSSLLASALGLQWDLQQKRGELDRERRERKHQRELTRSQQQFRHQLSQLKSLQAAIEEDTKLHLLSSLESKWDRWNTSAALQATARSQRMKEKQYQDEKKKRQLDRRRVELERERVESVCVVSQHRKHLESRAEENREARAHNESMERQLRRAAAERRHEEKVRELEEETRVQGHALRNYLEQRDDRAQQSYLSQRKHRENLIRQASECQGQRALKARQVLEEIEGQLEEWRTEVATHHQQSITQATESAQRVLTERRERVASERNKRVAGHSERMGHLSEEQRQKQLMYSEEIELKSDRSDAIAMEKKSCLEKSRQAARVSANQRQRVKDKYLRNSFDKMALEAEMLASLERKHLTNRTAQTQSKAKASIR